MKAKLTFKSLTILNPLQFEIGLRKRLIQFSSNKPFMSPKILKVDLSCGRKAFGSASLVDRVNGVKTVGGALVCEET